MTGQVEKRTVEHRRNWPAWVAGGCAGMLLWSSVPAVSEVAAPAPAVLAPPAAISADRETLMRVLAEEMTSRLVTALSNQARSHATEVATLEFRLRQAEERLDRAEAARREAEAAYRGEVEEMRGLLARAESAVSGVSASQAAMTASLAERDEDVARLKTALVRSLGELGEARQEARRQAARHSEAAGAGEAVARDVAELRQRLDAAAAELERARDDATAMAAERDRLQAASEAARMEVATLRVDRDVTAGERDALSDRLELVAAQAVLPAEAPGPAGLESRALERLGQIEQFLSSTGINVGRLSAPVPAKGAIVPPPLPASRQGGRGGPFIPNLRLSAQVPPHHAEAALRVERQLDRLERVERVLRAIPLGAPLRDYSFESPFGPRSDPFKRRPAMHEGVDLSAPMRTPLRSTAPGTVVHAGWKSAYGKTVDVQHAGGLLTRYAHMAEIKVRDGEQVERGDIVGLLGSTGRSTGPHVHYEVMIEGRPVDPARFIGRK